MGRRSDSDSYSNSDSSSDSDDSRSSSPSREGVSGGQYGGRHWSKPLFSVPMKNNNQDATIRRQKDAIKRITTELDRAEAEYDEFDSSYQEARRDLEHYKTVSVVCDEAQGMNKRLWTERHRQAVEDLTKIGSPLKLRKLTKQAETKVKADQDKIHQLFNEVETARTNLERAKKRLKKTKAAEFEQVTHVAGFENYAHGRHPKHVFADLHTEITRYQNMNLLRIEKICIELADQLEDHPAAQGKSKYKVARKLLRKCVRSLNEAKLRKELNPQQVIDILARADHIRRTLKGSLKKPSSRKLLQAEFKADGNIQRPEKQGGGGGGDKGGKGKGKGKGKGGGGGGGGNQQAASSSNGDTNKGKGVKFCNYCKINGHLISECRRVAAANEKKQAQGNGDAKSEPKNENKSTPKKGKPQNDGVPPS